MRDGTSVLDVNWPMNDAGVDGFPFPQQAMRWGLLFVCVLL